MSDDWTEHDPADDWTTEDAVPVDAPVGDPAWDDGQWEEYRAPMSAGKRLLVAGTVILAVLVLAAAATTIWVQRKIDPPGAPGDLVAVEIVSGSTTEDIGVVLADAGVITSPTVWNYWTRLRDKGPFQAGEYDFAANSSFQEAVDVLEAGPRPPRSDRVTIPEGLTIVEIAARLADPTLGMERWSEQAILDAINSDEIRSRYQPDDATSKEGLLFPDTYEVADDADERTFVRRLVSEMDQRLAALDVEAKGQALGRTPYEIIIIASLIEEEARVAGDRTKISRVIHNRLEQGIPLGIDATNRYEAELAGRSRDDIDFSSDSPYNTRRVRGLPPTPIAAPGRAALDAALNPEDGTWIFYVLADEQGNHFFTESSREFNAAKQECIRKNLGCG